MDRSLRELEILLSLNTKAFNPALEGVFKALRGIEVKIQKLTAATLTWKNSLIQVGAAMKGITVSSATTAGVGAMGGKLAGGDTLLLARAINLLNKNMSRIPIVTGASAAGMAKYAGATKLATKASRDHLVTTKNSFRYYGNEGLLTKGIAVVRSQLLLLAFAFGSVVMAMKGAISASTELRNSLVGLGAVAKAVGESQNEATQAAQQLASTGLLSVSEAAGGLKNLLATGMSLPHAIELMYAFTDAAAFNRQGTLKLGEAVLGGTQGFKNMLCLNADSSIYIEVEDEGLKSSYTNGQYIDNKNVNDKHKNKEKKGCFVSLKELYSEKKFPNVISYDFKTGKYVTRKIYGIAKNGFRETYRVTFSDGTFEEATPNHRFYDVSGNMIMVKDLREGDKLLCVSQESLKKEIANSVEKNSSKSMQIEKEISVPNNVTENTEKLITEKKLNVSTVGKSSQEKNQHTKNIAQINAEESLLKKEFMLKENVLSVDKNSQSDVVKIKNFAQLNAEGNTEKENKKLSVKSVEKKSFYPSQLQKTEDFALTNACLSGDQAYYQEKITQTTKMENQLQHMELLEKNAINYSIGKESFLKNLTDATFVDQQKNYNHITLNPGHCTQSQDMIFPMEKSCVKAVTKKKTIDIGLIPQKMRLFQNSKTGKEETQVQKNTLTDTTSILKLLGLNLKNSIKNMDCWNQDFLTKSDQLYTEHLDYITVEQKKSIKNWASNFYTYLDNLLGEEFALKSLFNLYNMGFKAEDAERVISTIIDKFYEGKSYLDTTFGDDFINADGISYSELSNDVLKAVGWSQYKRNDIKRDFVCGRNVSLNTDEKEVVSVEYVGYQEVYDVEVCDTHNFVLDNGLLTTNSMLVDNVGVTLNLSIMQERYAKTLGTTAAKLTEAQKYEGMRLGILKEAKIFQGNANTLMGEYSGLVSKTSVQLFNMKAALGDAVIPLLREMLSVIQPLIKQWTIFAKVNKDIITTEIKSVFSELADVLRPLVPIFVTLIKFAYKYKEAIIALMITQKLVKLNHTLTKSFGALIEKSLPVLAWQFNLVKNSAVGLGGALKALPALLSTLSAALLPMAIAGGFILLYTEIKKLKREMAAATLKAVEAQKKELESLRNSRLEMIEIMKTTGLFKDKIDEVTNSIGILDKQIALLSVKRLSLQMDQTDVTKALEQGMEVVSFYESIQQGTFEKVNDSYTEMNRISGFFNATLEEQNKILESLGNKYSIVSRSLNSLTIQKLNGQKVDEKEITSLTNQQKYLTGLISIFKAFMPEQANLKNGNDDLADSLNEVNSKLDKYYKLMRAINNDIMKQSSSKMTYEMARAQQELNDRIKIFNNLLKEGTITKPMFLEGLAAAQKAYLLDIQEMKYENMQKELDQQKAGVEKQLDGWNDYAKKVASIYNNMLEKNREFSDNSIAMTLGLTTSNVEKKRAEYNALLQELEDYHAKAGSLDREYEDAKKLMIENKNQEIQKMMQEHYADLMNQMGNMIDQTIVSYLKEKQAIKQTRQDELADLKNQLKLGIVETQEYEARRMQIIQEANIKIANAQNDMYRTMFNTTLSFMSELMTQYISKMIAQKYAADLIIGSVMSLGAGAVIGLAIGGLSLAANSLFADKSIPSYTDIDPSSSSSESSRSRMGSIATAATQYITISPTVSISGQYQWIGSGTVEELELGLEDLILRTTQQAIDSNDLDLNGVSPR